MEKLFTVEIARNKVMVHEAEAEALEAYSLKELDAILKKLKEKEIISEQRRKELIRFAKGRSIQICPDVSSSDCTSSSR
jgi:DNA-binding transcriptional regulator/RsmH inhibitor MraZ